MKKTSCLLLSAGLLVLLCGCRNTQTEVTVQPVAQISQSAQAQNRYFGEVVSNQTLEIRKDAGKAVKERFVNVGQSVQKDEKLFSYDVEAAKIAAEKQKLEIEKMENEQKEFKNQLSSLEKQAKSASGTEKNRLLLEISTLKNDLLESEYRLKAKLREQEALEESLKTEEVLSPVDGVVQKVSDSEEGPYLVIQQTGDFRIRGTINELNLGGEIAEGAAVRVISRRDPGQVWNGTVQSVGKDPNAKEGEENPTRSSSYPFYVELEYSEGLLLGQHVYVEAAFGEEDQLWLPAGYVENVKEYPMEGRTTGTVWADNGSGKLEQRTVTLGNLNADLGSYPVVEGLSAEAWIADPASEGCREGTLTRGRTEHSDPAESSKPLESETESMEETR